MSRFPHFLRAPKRSAQPSLCIWLDTETRASVDARGTQRHALKFGWGVYQSQRNQGDWSKPQWIRFDANKQLWDFVCSKTHASKALYLFAHNGAFDLTVTAAFTELPARGWKLVKAVCDAPPIILKWTRDKATIIFIDTLNIWRMPLAKVAKGNGMEKLPMPAEDASTEAWDTYGKNDADIIRVAVINWLAFIARHDLGPFAHTLASQAFKTFKYRFMDHEIFIDNNAKANALSRAAYVGGRVECFAIGTFRGPLFYLDVNSMYPAVMREHDYPTKLRAVYARPDQEEIEKWRAEYLLIADVEIETDAADYPLIADKKLLYPTGIFRCTLAHPELMRAYERGHVRRWFNVALYDKAPVFRAFVDMHYALRQAADAAGNETDKFNIKIMMNSLYGKFGQRGRRYEECGETDPNAVWTHTEIDLDSETVIRYRAFGGLVQAWIDDAESSESFPAIAACVTSHARVMLLDAIERAGRDNVLYCDTDSMIVNPQGYEAMRDLVDNKQLGKWKNVKHVNVITIHGPKDYEIDGERVTKGIRATAVRIAHNTYEQDKFVGFRGLLQRGKLDAPLVERVRKKLKRVYTKGKVLKSGKVKPLRVSRNRGGAGGHAKVRARKR